MNNNNTSFTLKIVRALLILILPLLFSACGEDEEPVKENVPELITKVTLTFTPADSGTVVIVNATDPDGEGVQDIAVDGSINLRRNVTYSLAIQLYNTLAEETSEEYNVTAEVDEQSNDHLFLFSWTGNVFSDPEGDGNIDNRADDINYSDTDDNGLPLGLTTSWTSATEVTAGTFRLLLKHQPGIKTSSSGSADGETDVDVQFPIIVQ